MEQHTLKIVNTFWNTQIKLRDIWWSKLNAYNLNTAEKIDVYGSLRRLFSLHRCLIYTVLLLRNDKRASWHSGRTFASSCQGQGFESGIENGGKKDKKKLNFLKRHD
jgi:hypothetical protein